MRENDDVRPELNFSVREHLRDESTTKTARKMMRVPGIRWEKTKHFLHDYESLTNDESMTTRFGKIVCIQQI